MALQCHGDLTCGLSLRVFALQGCLLQLDQAALHVHLTGTSCPSSALLLDLFPPCQPWPALKWRRNLQYSWP
ncbi:hypothetical protein BKA62DRAFT_700341 [Auriculariales sp. MPI-PUGE-AT-0066]|nr:hypothetical protein BKA62DRAFT_700341 [Auriculariales sp. MPI-PUGE-AT-0066]